MVTAMEVNSKDTTLVTADSSGFLFVWNISGYCLAGREDEPPERESSNPSPPNFVCFVNYINYRIISIPKIHLKNVRLCLHKMK